MIIGIGLGETCIESISGYQHDNLECYSLDNYENIL